MTEFKFIDSAMLGAEHSVEAMGSSLNKSKFEKILDEISKIFFGCCYF